MKNIHNNKSGVVLVIALLVVMVTVILSTVYVTKAVHEKAMFDREINAVKALYIAEGGGGGGLWKLDDLINTNLSNTIKAANPLTLANNAATYVANNDSIGLLVAYTKNGATPLLTAVTANGIAIEANYNGINTVLNGGIYKYSIKLTPKGNPITTAANTWDFPYYYRIQVSGDAANQSKKFTINGDFTVRVQKDNFARFALFTNNQTLPNGTPVWFTNSTNFSGPMFTNGQFNFAKNPSGTFLGNVAQANALAKFYNNNNPVNLNANANGTIDVPNFAEGFTRSAAGISPPTASQESAMVTQATAGNTYSTNGIYIPNSNGALTGGIYVKGDASNVIMSVDGNNRAVYTISQGATIKMVTVDHVNNQTIVAVGGTSTTFTGKPNGVDGVGTIVYVDGNINALGGTIQKDTQAVIAAHNDAVVQGHVVYSEYTSASGTPGTTGYVAPSAEGKKNLLGIMSWAGNLRIGTSAPADLNIHATLMAQAGIVTVDNYTTTAPRGTATVLGGVISNNYGGFNTFNGTTGQIVSGYGRNFVYDTRMETQYTPPYFPTLSTFIAFTNDINDKKFWQSGGF